MSITEVKQRRTKICRVERFCESLLIRPKRNKNNNNVTTNVTNNSMNSSRQGMTDELAAVIFMDVQDVNKLKDENDLMKLIVGDYHRGVELLMDAFRKRAYTQLDARTTPAAKENSQKLRDTIILQSSQIFQMHELLQNAVANEDNDENSVKECIAYLSKENEVLRELYEISKEFGSNHLLISFTYVDVKDKSTQTYDDPADDPGHYENENETENETENENKNKNENDVNNSDGFSDSDDDDVITVINLKIDDDKKDSEKQMKSSEKQKYPDQRNVPKKDGKLHPNHK